MKIIKNIALVAIGVAVGKHLSNHSITVTDKNDLLLADIRNKDAIVHDSVRVYINQKELT